MKDVVLDNTLIFEELLPLYAEARNKLRFRKKLEREMAVFVNTVKKMLENFEEPLGKGPWILKIPLGNILKASEDS